MRMWTCSEMHPVVGLCGVEPADQLPGKQQISKCAMLFHDTISTAEVV
jgi:hypothetical protein